MNRTVYVAAAVLVCFVSAMLQAAQVLPDIPSVKPTKIASRPKIDGDLSDECWRTATRVSGFTRFQKITHLGSRGGSGRAAAPSAQTDAWIAYDEAGLYVAFRCEEPKPDALVANAEKRDGPVSRDDCVEVFLAPGTSGSWYYHFIVNSKGVYQDQLCRLRPRVLNNAWDGEITVGASVSEKEWRVEMAIPWHNFGEHLDDGRWLVQLCRARRVAEPEYSSWSFANGNFHNVERFGKMSKPQVDFGRYQGLRLHSVKIPKFGFERGRFSYTVQGALENTTGKERNVVMQFADRPTAGNGTQVEHAATLPARGTATFDITMPIDSLGQRTLALRVLDAGSREPIFVTAFPEDSFPQVAQVFLDRDYYTSEKCAHAVATTTLPRGVEGLFLRVESKGAGSWRAPIRDTGRTAIEIPLADVPGGTYSMGLTVEDDAGRVVAEDVVELKKQAPAPQDIHEVKVDRDRLVILVDGKPFFPICIYNIPPDYLKECADAGFNMTLRWGGGRLDGIKSIEGKRRAIAKYLDAIHAAGMYALEYPTGFEYISYGHPQFSERIQRFMAKTRPVVLSVSAKHPAVIGYYVLDEPSEPHRKVCDKFISIVREHDPYRPSYILFSTGVKQWPDVYDFAGRDYYFRHHAPLITVHRVAVKEVERATRARVAYWHVPLCEADSSRCRGESLPVTGPEQRAQTYLAVIGGVKGMLWWLWPPRFRDNWDMLKQMAGELRRLSPALLEVTPRQRIEWEPRDTAEIVQAVVKAHEGQTYLITANSIQAPVEVSFRLPTGWAQRGAVLFEDREIALAGGRFSERLEGYGRHVYVFDRAWPDGGTLEIVGTRSLATEETATSAPKLAGSPPNVIPDPGFESDLYWRFSTGSKVDDAVSGALEPDEDNASERFLVIRRQHEKGRAEFRGWPVKLKPNTRYLFGVKARSEGPASALATAYLEGHYPHGDYLRKASLCRMRNQTPELEPYVRTFTTKNRPALAAPVLRFEGGPGTAWFDDIYLYEGPTSNKNRIANGSFEDDVSLRQMAPAWNFIGDPTPGSVGGADGLLRYDEKGAFEGNRSFYVAKGQGLKARVRGPLKADDPYVLSLYLKAAQPNTTVRLQIGWSTHVKRQIKELKLSSEWRRYEFPTVIRRDLDETFVKILVTSGTAAWVDSVRFERESSRYTQ